MSFETGVFIGGFSEGHEVLEPYADAMVQAGVVDRAMVYTAAEYRRKPVSDDIAATALFDTHSAGSAVLAESYDRAPRKYATSAVLALNGVEPTGVIAQGLRAAKIGTEKIEPEGHLLDDMGSMLHPARELRRHAATAAWIPRRVRRFSTSAFLRNTVRDNNFRSGRFAAWSDDDSFGFTPDDDAIDELNRFGVTAGVFEGKHNRVLFQPESTTDDIENMLALSTMTTNMHMLTISSAASF